MCEPREILVQAAGLSITFKSDHSSNTNRDPSAIHTDTDADTGGVETISFWLARDSSSLRTGPVA